MQCLSWNMFFLLRWNIKKAKLCWAGLLLFYTNFFHWLLNENKRIKKSNIISYSSGSWPLHAEFAITVLRSFVFELKTLLIAKLNEFTVMNPSKKLLTTIFLNSHNVNGKCYFSPLHKYWEWAKKIRYQNIFDLIPYYCKDNYDKTLRRKFECHL